MKKIILKGGLGNQMFQYAFSRYIEKTCGDRVSLDLSRYDEIDSSDKIRRPRILQLNIQYSESHEKNWFKVSFLGSNFNKILNNVILLGQGVFNSKYLLNRKSIPSKKIKLCEYNVFDGYWQSWKYVESVKEILYNDFSPAQPLSQISLTAIDSIKKTNSVFIGIRRGDYLSSKSNRRLYGDFDIEYFINAMNIIEDNVENPTYYVFSNDINGVKSDFCFGQRNVVLMEDEFDDLEQLFIMGSCQHAIIVNSTYYWWAAWLINNERKVIVAPKRWFANGWASDIIPSHWHRV